MFILTKDRPENSHEEWKAATEAYNSYLESIKARLPHAASEFATAQWHYDFGDHRAPHDAWLESLIIREPSHGDRSQYRSIDIAVRLLGAYHDGYIELTYIDVQSYCLKTPFTRYHPAKDNKGHEDWLYDEVRLSDNGYVLHEVEWSRGGEWLVESKDIEYQWLPAA